MPEKTISAVELGDRASKAARLDDRKHAVWRGLCLKFVRTLAGAPAVARNATTAWQNAERKHTAGVPPRGSVVFWTGGAAGHGHVAISAGGGKVWSTDAKRPGLVDLVSIAYLGAKWPSVKYAGWAEDVNGVRITELSVVPATVVTLENLTSRARNADVQRLQEALRRAGYGRLNPSGATGYYGDETVAMVRSFQEAQGWTGEDADGYPGTETLARLGLVR